MEKLKIKDLRKEKNMLQSDMAILLNQSLPSYINRENGKIPFNIGEAKAICSFFNVEINEIDWSLKNDK